MFTLKDEIAGKLVGLGEQEIIAIAIKAMEHLIIVTGSRNSFTGEFMQSLVDNNLELLPRSEEVQKLHMEAVNFVQSFYKDN